MSVQHALKPSCFGWLQPLRVLEVKEVVSICGKVLFEIKCFLASLIVIVTYYIVMGAEHSQYPRLRLAFPLTFGPAPSGTRYLLELLGVEHNAKIQISLLHRYPRPTSVQF